MVYVWYSWYTSRWCHQPTTPPPLPAVISWLFRVTGAPHLAVGPSLLRAPWHGMRMRYVTTSVTRRWDQTHFNAPSRHSRSRSTRFSERVRGVSRLHAIQIHYWHCTVTVTVCTCDCWLVNSSKLACWTRPCLCWISLDFAQCLVTVQSTLYAASPRWLVEPLHTRCIVYESTKSTCGFSAIFSQTVGSFSSKFYVPIVGSYLR